MFKYPLSNINIHHILNYFSIVNQVKFSSNNPPNGDAKIDIASGQSFSGLTKEELMKYADDPFWVRIRWVLFIVFW